MKLTWSGAGALIPILGGIAFLAAGLGLNSQDKGSYWAWGGLALLLAVVFLPLGWFLNRDSSAQRSHDFMGIPMQFWGGLLLLVGVGLFVAEAVTQGGTWMERAGVAAAPGPCEELGSTLATCSSSIGPMAGMFQSLCTASDPAMQTACLACVRGSADPCNPESCRSACNFGPPRP